MPISRSILFALLTASLPLAAAQAPVQPDGKAPASVVITAPRPEALAAYRATEARIRRLLAHRPASSDPYLGKCLEQAFMAPSPYPGTMDELRMKMRIGCARKHIWAKDTTLQQALDAFGRQDYTAALGLFEAAYAKMGTLNDNIMLDAALMLAKMHLDGLGTPKDTDKGIRWLKEIADGYYNPQRDWMRFNPDRPDAMNARIEAALMLARLYGRGGQVAQDTREADQWLARAVEFGYIPAPVTTGRDLAALPAPEPGAPVEPLAAAAASASTAPALREDDSANGAARGPDPSSQVDPGAFIVVRVTGLRAVPWKSYRAMRAAVAAYEAYRFLAPDAVFSFALMAPPGKTLPPNFALRVRTRDGEEFPIVLEDGELFQLPVLPDPEADADLVSNFKDGPLRIGLLVHTRSVAPEKERLGDVRLRNQISQAIADVDHPNDDPRCLRKRAGHNGCPGHRVTVWYRPRAPASGASIVEGERRAALEANRDPVLQAYKMPISGGNWGDDAIIEFDYKRPLPRPRLSSVAIYTAND